MSTAAAFEEDAASDVDVWGIVVAAGSGARFGGAKQYATLGGKRVVDWSLAVARQSCGAVVLVVPPDREDVAEPAADHVVARRRDPLGVCARRVSPWWREDAERRLRHRRARRRATVCDRSSSSTS